MSRDVAMPVIQLLDSISALDMRGHFALMPPAADYGDVERTVLLWASARQAAVNRLDYIGQASGRRVYCLDVILDEIPILTLHAPDAIVEERERPIVVGTWQRIDDETEILP